MSLFMKLKRKKLNNSGLTLIEIVVAIAVLAIVSGPLLKSFMLSSEINRKSRKSMCANDAAMMVMEGLADKSYSEIVSALTAVKTSGAVAASGKTSLSSVNNGFYNTGSNCVAGNLATVSGCNITKVNTVFNSVSVAGKDLTKNMDFLMKIHDSAWYNYSLQVPTKETALYTYEGTAGMVLVYGNVLSGSYNFDVVVSFIPLAETMQDVWYMYDIYLTVYDHAKDGTVVSEHFDTTTLKNHRINTMHSGTANSLTPTS